MNPIRPPRHADLGQAAVELALVLPLVVVAVLAVAQIGVVVRDEIVANHAAREAARAAAVSADPAGAAADAVAATTDLPAVVTTSTTASRVSVTVTVTGSSAMPFLGLRLGRVTHVATATMALEPP